MEYKCEICVKNYSSYNSLWNHNKKNHNPKIVKDVNNVIKNVKEKVNIVKEKKYECDICNRIFSCRQSKYEHKKNICNKIKLIKKKDNEETEIIKLKLEIDLLKLKLELKTNPTNFKSFNKMLKDKSYNSNNVVNSNNIINNTFNLVGFGKENILESLSLNDKKTILSSKYQCIEKLIEISNCGNNNQYKNIIITNLKDNYAYKYDDNLGYFVVTNKNEAINDLINNRVMDIEAIYDELSTANKIDQKTKNIIETFINKINNENEKFEDQNDNITYNTYKDFKIHNIKILLYNNQDKITKDIALFYSTNINDF